MPHRIIEVLIDLGGTTNVLYDSEDTNPDADAEPGVQGIPIAPENVESNE